MDAERFDAFVRSLLLAVPRRTALGGVLGTGLTAIFGGLDIDDAAAKKKRRKNKRKKKCKGDKKKCGKTCIPATECCGGCGENQVCCEGTCAGCCTNDDCAVNQACVAGACGCPEAACAAATDPTDDQFESCFCELATDGQAHCFANLSCSDPPPACQETSECDGGAVCLGISCQGVSRCSPVCSLR